MSTETLTLRADCLLSKWGFNDGNIPDELLDWLEVHRDMSMSEAIHYWHYELFHLVTAYLVPALDQYVGVTFIEGYNHNPVQVYVVDGKLLDDGWNDAEPHLTPESVEVPYSAIFLSRQVGGPVIEK